MSEEEEFALMMSSHTFGTFPILKTKVYQDRVVASSQARKHTD